MNKFKNILLIAIVALTSSCLNEDLKDQLYEDDIYNNASNIYINAVAVLYNYIKHIGKTHLAKPLSVSHCHTSNLYT